MTKSKLTKLQSSLVEKIQRRLSLNNPNYSIDEDLVNDYIETAVVEIEKWARPNEDTIASGTYNAEIIEFVLQSLGANGAEGLSSYSDAAEKRSFYSNPLSSLKSKIPQRL